jgi:hypothetical protein
VDDGDNSQILFDFIPNPRNELIEACGRIHM